MQSNVPNKQQTAGSTPAVCPDCKGTKKVVAKGDGRIVTCYRCRGTGVSGGYSVK